MVLESTTYPGTTRERFVPLLEESGLAAGRDFFLAFSPERIDPGRTDYTLRTTPKVVGRADRRVARRARSSSTSRSATRWSPVSTPEAAELTKLLENVFRSVNIALVNELAILCDRMGIDIWEVVDAAATKPYGFMSFKPGPGMGGHCLPVDPFYLAWRAREFDMQTEFIELAGEVNQRMPYFCVEKIARALNDHAKPGQAARAWRSSACRTRPGWGTCASRPRMKIMRLLREQGADVAYHDDFVPELPDFGLRSEWPRGRRLRRDRDRAPRPRRRAHRARVRAAGRGLPGRHARDRGFQPRASLTRPLRPSDRAPGLLLGEGVELPEAVRDRRERGRCTPAR